MGIKKGMKPKTYMTTKRIPIDVYNKLIQDKKVVNNQNKLRKRAGLKEIKYKYKRSPNGRFI